MEDVGLNGRDGWMDGVVFWNLGWVGLNAVLYLSLQGRRRFGEVWL
jgi:hypothetical protein